MYKVFKLSEKRWKVYWVVDPDRETPPPQGGDHTSAKSYPYRQAAHRRCKQLNDNLKERQLMKWNPQQQAYYGVTSDGRTVRVEGVEYLESQRDGADQELLDDPDSWASLAGDNQNVEYVHPRPSQS